VGLKFFVTLVAHQLKKHNVLHVRSPIRWYVGVVQRESVEGTMLKVVSDISAAAGMRASVRRVGVSRAAQRAFSTNVRATPFVYNRVAAFAAVGAGIAAGSMLYLSSAFPSVPFSSLPLPPRSPGLQTRRRRSPLMCRTLDFR
jgi:hypothetical protein